MKKDTELEKWFTKLAKSILSLKYVVVFVTPMIPMSSGVLHDLRRGAVCVSYYPCLCRYSSSNHSKTGRKIQLMLEALVNVEQFEEIDTSLQIKEFLQHSRDFLMNMVRMGQITNSTMSTLDQVRIDGYCPSTRVLRSQALSSHAADL